MSDSPTMTPNELAAQRAQLHSVPQSTASHGSTKVAHQDWKPLGSIPMGAVKHEK